MLSAPSGGGESGSQHETMRAKGRREERTRDETRDEMGEVERRGG
jgi:hypothetical protein